MRELRNVVQRAMIGGRGSAQVEVVSLPHEVRGSAGGNDPIAPLEGRTLDEVARLHIERTLKRHAGNRTHASRALGISRATLIKKIREFGLAAANG